MTSWGGGRNEDITLRWCNGESLRSIGAAYGISAQRAGQIAKQGLMSREERCAWFRNYEAKRKQKAQRANQCTIGDSAKPEREDRGGLGG